MSDTRTSLSSVTRWLLVVLGCVVLETTQPMIAAPDSVSDSKSVFEPVPEPTPAPTPAPVSAAERTGETVIYPSGTPGSARPEGATSGGGGGTWLFAALVCLGAAGWVYWKKRYTLVPTRKKGGLLVEETRALGNRQYLVVAACDGKRFLLGVAPGSIRLLSPLDAKFEEPEGVDDEAP